MIRFLYADQLEVYPKLARTMFEDRAKQFRDRLRWPVKVDAHGQERDQYDALNPLYVIWERPDGSHGGSMRFLPTTGRTMVHEHFLHLTDGVKIESPLIWECTRFCLAEGASPRVAAALMMAGSELMRGHGVEHFLGVFDAPMTRVYRQIGSSPTILGSAGKGRAMTSVGLWAYSEEAKAKLVRKAGISEALMRLWYERAFGRPAKRQKEAVA